MAGWFAPEDGHLAFHTTRAVLREPGGAVVVDLDEFAIAEPDPLALAEAQLLTHLADAHPDAVERLTRLVEPDSLHGAVRVQPLAVDRHGLTLRIERARGHGDVRLPFHRPADDVGQLTERMHVLLTQASSRELPAGAAATAHGGRRVRRTLRPRAGVRFTTRRPRRACPARLPAA